MQYVCICFNVTIVTLAVKMSSLVKYTNINMFEALDPATMTQRVLEGGTAWQMLKALSDLGWQACKQPSPAKLKAKPLVPHTAAGTDLKYYVGLKVHKEQRHYLMTLCSSRSMFESGAVLAVHHAQTSKYYKKVLNGQHNGVLAIALPAAPVAAVDLGGLICDVEEEPEDSGALAAAVAVPPDESESEHNDDDDMRDSSEHTSDIFQDDESGDADDAATPQAAAIDIESPHDDDAATPVGLGIESPHPFSEGDSGVGGLIAEPDQSVQLELDRCDADPSLPPPVERPPPLARDEVDEAPRAQPRVDGPARTRGSTHPDSFHWGPADSGFHLLYSPPEVKPPHGQWQATCHYHADSGKAGKTFTPCTRTMSVLVAGSKEIARDALMYWCMQAPLHDRKRYHCALPRQTYDLPDRAIMLARARALRPPPPRGKLKTDEELDEQDTDELDDPDDDAGPDAGDAPAPPAPPPAKRARRGSGRGSGARGSADSGARGSGGARCSADSGARGSGGASGAAGSTIAAAAAAEPQRGRGRRGRGGGGGGRGRRGRGRGGCRAPDDDAGDDASAHDDDAGGAVERADVAEDAIERCSVEGGSGGSASSSSSSSSSKSDSKSRSKTSALGSGSSS